MERACENCGGPIIQRQGERPRGFRLRKTCSKACSYELRAAKAQVPVLERLASKYAVDRAGCWVWQATTAPNGYGQIGLGRKVCYAHRVSYEAHVGPIPPGLDLDHLCRNRACVNPAHLEPVTRRENLMRGIAPVAEMYRTGRCLRGHSMEDAYVQPNGHRRCRECMDLKRAERKARA